MSADTENTQGKHSGLIPWKPGQSGNPKGKPKGSRNKLGQALTDALLADFEEHGAAAVVRVREEEPGNYLRVVASLLPKEIKVERTDGMTDDQLRTRIRQLAADLGTALGVIEGISGPSGGTEAPPRPN